MKDVTGKELRLGSTVAFVTPRYRGLTLGEVVKVTPTGVQVAYKEDNSISNTFRTASYVCLVS